MKRKIQSIIGGLIVLVATFSINLNSSDDALTYDNIVALSEAAAQREPPPVITCVGGFPNVCVTVNGTPYGGTRVETED